MGLLNDLFRKRRSPGDETKTCQVELDAEGKVSCIKVPQGRWSLQAKGQSKYYSQQAPTLLQAAEILKKLSSIPPLTYYVVETPDGSLGRDIQGFYTESPVKTKNIVAESRGGGPEAVEIVSLTGFGDMMANQTGVAQLKSRGHYARLVLLMKCGHCGYESPVETEAGPLVRECYCCGVQNRGHRGNINVFLGSSMVKI